MFYNIFSTGSVADFGPRIRFFCIKLQKSGYTTKRYKKARLSDNLVYQQTLTNGSRHAIHIEYLI
jgi:hypothetical protein